MGNADADALLSSDPLALLIGMLLDQQIPMETAFAGPKKLAERLATFDAATITAMDPDEFAALCAQPPAVHRFPGAMAKRIQALCQHLEENYDGKADAVWTQGSPDGREILKRLKTLPGYGDQKARIFLALLGKQLKIDATGWREAAGDYGQDGARRSIADVVDDQTLQEVRDFKRQMKAAKKK
ncbi:hypothetical protein AS9A_2112 [Hoyosella subflava DQS3-9A1]|uniref:HhH-GPD domain-containing protein n=1 Tax=Hoyosella subflava (strain DSM 45089 / JCM 17490 / NBRC 109087 / DQS3-9A1) TaxID=443218 RepID=F6EPT2_HOYSD|nr:hypothetical protein AS9A_2112 [Hoyosella subflava DQS3-9A1]